MLRYFSLNQPLNLGTYHLLTMELPHFSHQGQEHQGIGLLAEQIKRASGQGGKQTPCPLVNTHLSILAVLFLSLLWPTSLAPSSAYILLLLDHFCC